jgi:hypothetical protein
MGKYVAKYYGKITFGKYGYGAEKVGKRVSEKVWKSTIVGRNVWRKVV